jgi:hypothetical protein
MIIKIIYGRSVRETSAKTTVATQRGASITILGAMCEKGIINFTLRKSTAVVSKKKRKLIFSCSVDVNGRIGTRTTYYLHFLSSAMDVLDQHNMKSRYLVMDNAPIHRSSEVKGLVSLRRHKCIFHHTHPF